jgi:Ca-activated chloride channel family protein
MLAYLPRRAVVSAAVVVLFAAAVPHPAQADEAAAWKAWRAKRYASAQTLYAEIGGYAGQMGAGAAAWRQVDYAAAARHFGAALLLAANDRQRADALFNLGNALYARGQWLAAYEAFETVLRVRPSDRKARANLDYAWQRLRRQRAEAPMHSDLGGRRGFLAEGRIQLDGQAGQTLEDPESEAPGVQVDRNAQAADAARRQGDDAPRRPLTADSRMALSGLKKLERLEDRPAAMLKNLLKQDAHHDGAERPPW